MCDSFVVSGQHSRDGITLFAKNSDRSAREPQAFVQFPAAFHPMGAEAQCTHISIPQVAETYGVMGHSPGWVWGFEQGVNEHAVAIGNHSVFSREPLETEPGLIGMDLVRLGLERGRDAREALEVIATLIEQHGQAGSARRPGGAGYHNAFLLADPGQAWQMETSGRRWGARRGDLALQTNHLSMRSNWSIGSRDLESFARLQGWWSGRERLDFAAAYRDPTVPSALSEGRSERGAYLLESSRGQH
ncbi:C69 family dipeptidase, partial [Myxococcota bacterium]|nr:C69 family dipeptidase [Myxococcota bacterium]